MWMKEHNGQTENMLENRFPFPALPWFFPCLFPLAFHWATLEVYATCICTEKRILISFSIDNFIACVSHTQQFRWGLVTYIVKYTCLASIVWVLFNNFISLQVSKYMTCPVFVGKTSYWPFVYCFCTASHHCIL